ncbi:MAG: hypothetical protein JWN01_752 [Patescibacteria group bacterium]|nr:hypothetical protein [Patescibacteria group bacterium]
MDLYETQRRLLFGLWATQFYTSEPLQGFNPGQTTLIDTMQAIQAEARRGILDNALQQLEQGKDHPVSFICLDRFIKTRPNNAFPSVARWYGRETLLMLNASINRKGMTQSEVLHRWYFALLDVASSTGILPVELLQNQDFRDDITRHTDTAERLWAARLHYLDLTTDPYLLRRHLLEPLMREYGQTEPINMQALWEASNARRTADLRSIQRIWPDFLLRTEPN